MHGSEAVSPWVARWAHLVPASGTVLDVACGLGRHALHFSQLNHPVVLVDRAQAAIESVANRLPATSQCIIADIENGPWPFTDSLGKPQQFAGVVVTNYLWRALLPTIVASVAPGGVLIYETFAAGNETVGKPSRPDFLLQPGELLTVCAGLRVVAYEDGFVSNPERFVQRIVAVRPVLAGQAHQNSANPASISSPSAPTRYAL
ncbi:MAG: class I SAM-dependent methyltransferase [Burkholderiaceae bacterium]